MPLGLCTTNAFLFAEGEIVTLIEFGAEVSKNLINY